jgi:hypothetical protein
MDLGPKILLFTKREIQTKITSDKKNLGTTDLAYTNAVNAASKDKATSSKEEI